MKILFAQGNPEARFDGTRHNVGFALIDAFAKEHGASWAEKAKFHAYTTELTIGGEKALLVKPTTFYNDTGLTARAVLDFYKAAPEDFLVIHDDLALPFGTIRVRSSGGDAGNNGIKSINAAIGEGYRRIRIGTWNEQRNQIDDVNFVLGKFNTDERKDFPNLEATVSSLIEAFVSGTLTDHSTAVL